LKILEMATLCQNKGHPLRGQRSFEEHGQPEICKPLLIKTGEGHSNKKIQTTIQEEA
jgi:hypothetical protein